MMTRAMIVVCAAAMLAGCGASSNFVPRGDRAATTAVTPKGVIGRPAVQATALRVMSFNVRVATLLDVTNHWTWRKDVLVDTIRGFGPDVLGTQELLDEQAAYIQAELPQYAFVGAGRNNGKLSGGEMCGIFYRRDRFRQVDAGHFWLSDEPDEPGSRSWGSWFTRMTTWVKLAPLAGGGEPFYVFNTHFDVGSERARRESAKLIRRQIAKLAGSAPVVITGDFNDTEGTDTYQTLLAGKTGPRLIDAFRHVHPQRRADEATHHGFDGDTQGQRIDWILTSPTLEPVDAAIVRHHDDGRYPSDHYPVTAVLKLKSQGLATAIVPAAPAPLSRAQ